MRCDHFAIMESHGKLAAWPDWLECEISDTSAKCSLTNKALPSFFGLRPRVILHCQYLLFDLYATLIVPFSDCPFLVQHQPHPSACVSSTPFTLSWCFHRNLSDEPRGACRGEGRHFPRGPRFWEQGAGCRGESFRDHVFVQNAVDPGRVGKGLDLLVCL